MGDTRLSKKDLHLFHKLSLIPINKMIYVLFDGPDSYVYKWLLFHKQCISYCHAHGNTELQNHFILFLTPKPWHPWWYPSLLLWQRILFLAPASNTDKTIMEIIFLAIMGNALWHIDWDDWKNNTLNQNHFISYLDYIDTFMYQFFSQKNTYSL